jgi:hypothetical protein
LKIDDMNFTALCHGIVINFSLRSRRTNWEVTGAILNQDFSCGLYGESVSFGRRKLKTKARPSTFYCMVNCFQVVHIGLNQFGQNGSCNDVVEISTYYYYVGQFICLFLFFSLFFTVNLNSNYPGEKGGGFFLLSLEA